MTSAELFYLLKPEGGDMDKMVPLSDGIVNNLPSHVIRAAGFALRRGLWVIPLCGADCDGTRHGRKGHPSTACGKVPLVSGWADNPVKRIEDLPSNTGNIGVLTGVVVDVLDIDDEAGLAWATATQPATPWRVMTGAGVRQHWYFKRRPDDVNTGMVLSLGEGKSLHFRGERALVVAPHCRHWTGRDYTPVGNWNFAHKDLPFFNREAAEKIRGLARQGVRGLEGRKAAAVSDGRLPPSGKWTDTEVRDLIDDALTRMLPQKGDLSFRKNRFAKFLASKPPCRAGAASAEAMNILRCGIVHLLLETDLVLDMVSASRWACEATEADCVTLWPWRREQLADLAGLS